MRVSAGAFVLLYQFFFEQKPNEIKHLARLELWANSVPTFANNPKVQ
jgi:hypothetical protein